MTEDDAQAWVRARFGVPRETALARFAELVRDEAGRQNLIAASTLDHIWARHLVDSAQLVALAGDAPGPWIDIGTGAGFPGMVVAIVTERPMALVEPRARRVEFLRASVAALGLGDRVEVIQGRIESYKPAAPAAVISARAVAELGALFAAALHCSTRSTVWLLPKGRNAQSEVEAVTKAWQGSFHVEQSVTEPDSGIVIARGVGRR